jgi:hypothetical protein
MAKNFSPRSTLLLSFLLVYIFILNSFFSYPDLHSLVLQIDRHFSTFVVPDMTIEKLQKVATTHVDASFKAKWLRWWNSSSKVKIKNQFPSSLPLRERVLDEWLNKASFWAQVHFLVLFWISVLFSMLFLTNLSKPSKSFLTD